MKTNSMPLLLASMAAFAMTMTGYSQSPPKITVRLGQAVYWTTEVGGGRGCGVGS